MIWQKTGRRVSRDETTTIYTFSPTAWTVESRKRHIPHTNGSGTWDYTEFVVLRDGEEIAKKHRLMDAKKYVEEVIRSEITAGAVDPGGH